jgi:autotransporter-associated beta strand protein
MIRSALLVILLAVMAAPAMAADDTWLGVNTTWNDGPNNWSLGTPPAYDLTTDVAVFTGALTPAQPTFFLHVLGADPSMEVSGLRFESAGWTVTFPGWTGIGTNGVTVADGAGAVTLTSSQADQAAIMTSSPETWYVGTGSTLTVGGWASIYTSSPLIKTGAGTLQLFGNSRDGSDLQFQQGPAEVSKTAYNYLTGSITVGTVSTTATLTNKNLTGVETDVLSDDAILTINAGSTVDSTLGGLGCSTVNINGGSLILGTAYFNGGGQAVGVSVFGKGYYYGGPVQASAGTITMAGGSITGTPTTDSGSFANCIQLLGPAINATAGTSTINPMVYWVGGASAGPGATPALQPHVVTVAGGATLNLAGGIVNGIWSVDANDQQFVKEGAGTVAIGGNIQWQGSMTLNGGTLLYNGTLNESTATFNLANTWEWDWISSRNLNVVVNNTATLGGTGNIKLGGANSITVNAGGTISPGASVGTLTATGGSVLMGGVATPAKLLNEIDASGSDQLAMTGALTLNNGGTTELQLSLLNHFSATGTGPYTIVNGFSSLTGTFANAAGVSGSGRVDLGFKGWEGVITYNATDIVLSDLVMNGDTNGDGIVNFADYGNLTNNYNAPGDRSTGDMNGDGIVNFADYGILTNNYGVATPEPASLSLLVLGGLALIRRRR